MRQITDIKLLGALVKHVRKSQGLTQEQLAACGLGLRFVVELERGKPTSYRGKIMQVALRVLGHGVIIQRRILTPERGAPGPEILPRAPWANSGPAGQGAAQRSGA